MVNGMLNSKRLWGCVFGGRQLAASIVEFSDRRYAGNSSEEVLHAGLLAAEKLLSGWSLYRGWSDSGGGEWSAYDIVPRGEPK